jgi:hypothetical protein
MKCRFLNAGEWNGSPYKHVFRGPLEVEPLDPRAWEPTGTTRGSLGALSAERVAFLVGPIYHAGARDFEIDKVARQVDPAGTAVEYHIVGSGGELRRF